MRERQRLAVIFGCAGLISILSVMPGHASRVRPLGLEQLAGRAERIFAGRCIAVDVADDPATGLRVSRVTFAVQRWVKGTSTPTVTVRMLGDVRAKSADIFAGIPRFAIDEEVILFLDGDSRLGLTSPVGFIQGKLNVVHDKEGRAVAIPPLGRKALIQDAPVDARELLTASERSEGLDAATLLEVVARMVQRAPAPRHDSLKSTSGSVP